MSSLQELTMQRALAVSMLVSTALVSLGPVSVASADGMRCGSRLVSDGDSLYEVRERCGDPAAAQKRTELRTVRQYIDGPCYRENGSIRCGQVVERVVEITVDEWTYDFGPSQLIRHLTFEQGKLLHVGTGGYGTKAD